jgi:hypothetical protein
VLLLLPNIGCTFGQTTPTPSGKNVATSIGESGAAAPDGASSGNAAGSSPRFGRPLNVCTSSGQGLGVSCSGAPKDFQADKEFSCFSNATLPFCGYDLDLWKCVVSEPCVVNMVMICIIELVIYFPLTV